MALALKFALAAAVVALVVGLFYPTLFAREPPVATSVNASYDFVIVGGGAAGSVLASRLSEDPNVSVLLLEAGASDWGNTVINIPFLYGLAQGTDLDWAYTAERQDGILQGVIDEVSPWPRGKVLGGSGSINVMLAVRSSRHDYDRWARYTDDETWDYRHMLPYFKRMENVQIPEIRDSPFRGKNGPLVINGVRSSGTPLAEKLVQAGRQDLGLPDNIDYNGKSMEGIFHAQLNSANSKRMSASRAYLHPSMGRPNLDVAVNSHVQKVIIKDKHAVGVEVIRNGRKLTVKAKKEVILSAGSIGSPHILLLSGVGPKKQLEELHIPVAADLPVGENLQDHVMVMSAIGVSEPISFRIPDFWSTWTMIKYYLFGTGLWAIPSGEEVISFQSVTPESKKIDWPDLELHTTSFPINSFVMNIIKIKPELIEERSYRDEYDYGYNCLGVLLRPESRGTISLVSTDPFDYPRIRANYLNSQYDIDILIKGIEACRALANTKTMQSVGAKFLDTKHLSPCKQFEFDSHEYWGCVVKLEMATVYHPVGTCKMGPKKDPSAVLDSKLRVHGVSGLRVVDASIMPWITSGNTHFPSMVIAEKAADMILGKQPLPPEDLL